MTSPSLTQHATPHRHAPRRQKEPVRLQRPRGLRDAAALSAWLSKEEQNFEKGGTGVGGEGRSRNEEQRERGAENGKLRSAALGPGGGSSHVELVSGTGDAPSGWFPGAPERLPKRLDFNNLSGTCGKLFALISSVNNFISP